MLSVYVMKQIYFDAFKEGKRVRNKPVLDYEHWDIIYHRIYRILNTLLQ